jgi:hypothetical protein
VTSPGRSRATSPVSDEAKRFCRDCAYIGTFRRLDVESADRAMYGHHQCPQCGIVAPLFEFPVYTPREYIYGTRKPSNG